MPQVLLAAASGAAITAGAVIADVLLVAGVARGVAMARKARRQGNASLADRTSPARQSDVARTIVYGQTLVSDVLVYHLTHGNRRDVLSQVIVLAGHELSAITDVRFNDKLIGPLDGSGAVQPGSPYWLSRTEPRTMTYTAASSGTTQQLTLAAGEVFFALDSLAYETPAIETPSGPSGEAGAYLRGGESRTLVVGTDYTVSAGGLITMLSSAPQTLQVTATYRVDVGIPLARVYRFLGIDAGERDLLLESWSGGAWPASAIGRNVPRLHVVNYWHETIYADGLPAVSAIVQGKRVYDPRLDSTNGGVGAHRANTPSTWAYSANPALCAADYLRSDLGFGCASTEINWPSIIEAANICDETVPINGSGGTQSRYVCAGVLSTEDTRQENLQQILDAMVGTAFWSGGEWTIRAGAYRTPTLDLDADDLAGGDIAIQARANRRDLFNAIRGRYREPTQLYAVVDFPPYASSTYAAEDAGEVIYRDVDMPMVDDARRAQRIAKLLLFRARQALTMQASFKLSAYALQPGDTVRLTIARYGWSQKVFRVLRREFGNLSTVNLTLQEDASAIYAWDFSEAQNADPAPNTGLPDPRYVAPLDGVTVTSSAKTYYVRSDGVLVAYVEIAWAVPVTPEVRVLVFWKRATETEYRVVRRSVGDSYAWLEGVSPGDRLNIYLYVENAIGARSAASWIQNYTVSSGVLSGQQTSSANLLRNASFDYGAANWGIYESGVTNVTTIARHATSGYFIPGTPTSAYITIASSLSGNLRAGGARSVPVSCAPGEWIVAYASLIGWGTNALSTIAWYDASGARIGGTDGNVVIGWPVEAPQRRFDRIADYEVSAVLAQAPANARYAELVVIGTGAWDAGPFKYVSVHKPFIGKLPPGVRELPPWDGGSASMVATPDIIPGAISDEYVSATDGTVLAFTGSPDLQFQGPTLTPVVSGTLHIDCSFTLHAVANVSDGVGWDAYVFPEAGTPKSALTERGFLMTLPANAADVRSFSRTTSVPVVAGQSVSTRLLIVRRGLNETTPVTATGPQSKNVTLWRAAGSVYNIAFRATMNKR